MDDSVLYAAKNGKMLITLRLNEDDDGSNQSCDLLGSQLETRCAKPSFLRQLSSDPTTRNLVPLSPPAPRGSNSIRYG